MLGIFCIKIGIYLLGILRCENRAAYDRFTLRILFIQKCDRISHRSESCGHESRQSDKLHLIFNRGIQHSFGRNVSAKIYNCKSVAFKQNFYNIFADIVNISLDRRKNDFSL